jgi:hypothetical protein
MIIPFSGKDLRGVAFGWRTMAKEKEDKLGAMGFCFFRNRD